MKNNQTICQFLNIKLVEGDPFHIKHNDKVVYHENSYGYWGKGDYDSEGNQNYYENSEGYIIDDRPKELTMVEIAEKFGISVSQLKIKK